MSWRYREPMESDYDTYEEYLAALDNYESAFSDYEESLKDRR